MAARKSKLSTRGVKPPKLTAAEYRILDAKAYLRIEECALLTDMSHETVRSAIRDGRLPHVRLGPQTLRIRRVDLDALVTRDYTPDATGFASRRSA